MCGHKMVDGGRQAINLQFESGEKGTQAAVCRVQFCDVVIAIVCESV